MKTKLISLFALVFCIGAFLLPMTAYAAADTPPPTVKAWITGDVLYIEATGDLGVEAVFIDENRFNYRVDGVLKVDVREYADSGEMISVYAIDFAGNKSDVVTVENPYYSNPEEIPAPTPEDQAFTPGGTGTVVDDILEQSGKEFFSITTEEGNIFYLIVDRHRDNENVYLLNAVTEDDLLALAEKSDNKGGSAIPTPEPKPPTEPTESDNPAQPEEPPAKEKSNNGTMIFIVLAVIVAGGAGYYIKIVRPKQQADDFDEDDFDEDEGEEMEFEDEPEDSNIDNDGDYDENDTEDE